MAIRSNRPLALMLAGLWLSACAAPQLVPPDCVAIRAIPFSVPGPGKYCLLGDLTLPRDAPLPYAILVASDNVIDLNGYTLRGPGGGGGAGIIGVNAQRVTIRNGTVKDFNIGVSLGVLKRTPIPTSNVVERLHLEDNVTAGLWIAGADTVVLDNVVVNTGGARHETDGVQPLGAAYGIRLRGPGAKVVGNHVVNTHAHRDTKAYGTGIEITDGLGSEVRDNRIEGDSQGIGLSVPDATDIVVVGNTISGVRRGIVKNRVGQEPVDPNRVTSGGAAVLKDNSVSEAGLAPARSRDEGYRISLPKHHGFFDWPTAIAWSPDGKTVAIGTRLGFVGMYDQRTRARLRELESPGRSTRMELDYFTNYRPPAKDELFPAEGCRGGVCAVAFSPDGSILAAGSDDGLVRLWNARSGELQRSLSGHRDVVRSVAFSPDGKRLASTGDDRGTRLWDVMSGRSLRVMEWGFDPPIWPKELPIVTQVVQFSPDGKLLAVGGSGAVQLRDTASGAVLAQIDADVVESVSGARISKARPKFLLGSKIALSPDGRMLAFRINFGEARIGLWNTADKTVAKILSSPVRPGEGHPDYAYAFSPDGKLLAVGGGNGTLRMWHIDQGRYRELMPYRRAGANVDAVAFSPDGETLVSSEWFAGGNSARFSYPANAIRFWDVREGVEVFPASAPDGGSAPYSP